MTTSGTYVFSVNRDTIIRQGMLDIGAIDENEEPSASDIQDCSVKLNMLVKQWQGTADFAPGLKTWTRRRGYLFLSTTTGKYTLGPAATGWTTGPVNGSAQPIITATTTTSAAAANTITVATGLAIAASDKVGVQLVNGALQWTTVVSYVSGTGVITLTANLTAAVSTGAVVYDYTTTGTQPLEIQTCILRDSTNNDVSMNIIRDVQTYDALPQKANPQNQSDPGAIYYEWQLTNSNLFTDVGASSDVTKYLVMTYFEEIQDLNTATDTPEYPQEWFLPLCGGLGKLICPMYDRPWTPLLDENYKVALAIAQRKEPEVRMDYFQCNAET